MLSDVNALRSRFKATVAAANPKLVVVYDNQPNVTPPANAMWCRFIVQPTSKRRVQIGVTKKYEQLGIATLQIICPPQTGDAAAYLLADAADAAFKEWRSDDGALVIYETENQTIPSTATDSTFKINLRLYWRSTR